MLEKVSSILIKIGLFPVKLFLVLLFGGALVSIVLYVLLPQSILSNIDGIGYVFTILYYGMIIIPIGGLVALLGAILGLFKIKKEDVTKEMRTRHQKIVVTIFAILSVVGLVGIIKEVYELVS